MNLYYVKLKFSLIFFRIYDFANEYKCPGTVHTNYEQEGPIDDHRKAMTSTVGISAYYHNRYSRRLRALLVNFDK